MFVIPKSLKLIIAICILSPFCWNIIVKLYKTSEDSPLSFTLDTIYLNWNTTFPGVTVCEVYNSEKNWDISEMYFGPDRDHRLDDLTAEVAFFSGKCRACSICDDIECPESIDEIISTYRSSCSDLIGNCTWIEKPFDCCSEFLPLHTEFGTCFSFNSLQTLEKGSVPRYVNNRQTGAGILSFMVSEDVEIHIHPSNDVPYLMAEGTIHETITWGSIKEIVFNVNEIINDPSVIGLPIEKRKCKFTHEVNKKENRLYNFYSYSTCIVDCVKGAHLQMCNCSFNFKLFNYNTTTDKICDLKGLECLSENFENFVDVRGNCRCVSSCEEPEYNVLYSSVDLVNAESTSIITVAMINLPSQRYMRLVVRNNLDLIISVGGIVGLFFGASFLTIIEIFYNIYLSIEQVIKRKSTAMKSK